MGQGHHGIKKLFGYSVKKLIQKWQADFFILPKGKIIMFILDCLATIHNRWSKKLWQSKFLSIFIFFACDRLIMIIDHTTMVQFSSYRFIQMKHWKKNRTPDFKFTDSFTIKIENLKSKNKIQISKLSKLKKITISVLNLFEQCINVRIYIHPFGSFWSIFWSNTISTCIGQGPERCSNQTFQQKKNLQMNLDFFFLFPA